MSFAGGFTKSLSTAPPVAAGDDVPKTTVELSISCSGLKNKDSLSKSDPLCVVYMKGAGHGGPLGKSGGWTEFARTETMKNSLNPQWVKKIVCDYKFEEKQSLKFLVYDEDSSTKDVSQHDFLGKMECSLGEIVSAQSKGFRKSLSDGSGHISITALEVSRNKEFVHFNVSAKGLDNKDTFGKSDPYLQINRMKNGLSGTVVFKTETIDNDLNPKWKPFKLATNTLCANDENHLLEFVVYDYDSDGSHDLIGSFQTTLKQLSQASSSEFPLINEKRKAKKGAKYKNSGTLHINSLKREKLHTFLDYIQGGMQVNITMALDFTGSNGHPQDPNSLHYMHPDGIDNQYAVAIKAVGEIIQDYDSDKMFPVLGFGAKVPPTGVVSHEFFVTLDPNNPFCAGIQGIMQAYQRCLKSVQLFGPTNFSPVIEHVARFARSYKEGGSNYFVLLIVTDGIITDLEETKRSIVGASTLPMSIIIVGVGNEDFSAMQMLDGDRSRLSTGQTTADRDIVQFVEMRKYLRGDAFSKSLLAKEVLAEIPNQILGYMQKNGFEPGVVPS